MKLKHIALAAMLVATGAANAAMSGAASGNGELLVNFISQGGTSATAGGDDMSAVFDLGVNMNDFLLNKNTPGYKMTWDLKGANYGTAWNDLLAFSTNDAAIEFNVIALDNVNTRYLTTNDIATYTSLTNTGLTGFQNMDKYITANNSRGTHATQANGASTALATDASNTYFRAIGGLTQGDTWLTLTGDTTKTLATAQNFWSLSLGTGNGFAPTTKAAFGVDLNNNGSVGAAAGYPSEFGEWSVDAANGTITFLNPVPEPETYAMLLAGLGLMGAVARRRKSV